MTTNSLSQQTKSLLAVGQRVHCILYGGTDGTIYQIDGEQKPDTVGNICSIVATGGSAEFSIVWDNGTFSKKVPESILYGVQWRIYEEFEGAQAIKKRLAHAEQMTREREEAKQEEQRRFDEQVQKLENDPEYSDLIRAGTDNNGVAKNIRIELKKAFPGVKFSVRKPYYGSLNVSWTDGPTVEEVQDITRKYKDTYYNSYEDIHEYVKSPFRHVFGSVSYVSENRDFSDSVISETIALLSADLNLEGLTVDKFKRGDYIDQQVDGARISYLIWKRLEAASLTPEKEKEKPFNDKSLNDTKTAHIEKHQHTKHKFTMYIVISDRVSRDRFDELLTECRALNGWYSRKWGTTPGGFAFKSEASAQQFLSDHFAGEVSPDKKEVNKTAEPAAKKSNGIKTAEKLRKLAEGLQNTIDAKLADRLTNTPKRVAQAMRARLDGEQLQRVQSVALRLADMHEAGEVPELLKPFTTKAALMPMMSSKKEPVANGFHTYHACTGEPSKNTPEAAALWALLGEKSEKDIKADEIRQAVQSVQFVKIPGYFPTPDKVIDLMLDYANLSSNDRVLEPSAGGGAICDRIKEYTTNIVAIEKNTSLANILDLKGFNPENINFLDRMPVGSFDKVLMNPPFENLQDIDHVMHAYKFLKHGGRLVAIMSPSGFFRNDKKSVGFRAWLSLVGGEVIELPEGSFKESGTGVNTNLVIIDKLSEYH